MIRVFGHPRWLPLDPSTIGRLRRGELPGFYIIGDLVVFPTGEIGELRA